MQATHVACAHCGAVNRVPSERLADGPVCGRCGKDLLPAAPIELGDADFDRVVGRTDLPVLVDFWAPWCGPCRAMAPQFERAAAQLQGRALLVKVNSDEAPQLSARFGIRSIPTLVKLERGREVARQAGAVDAGRIAAFAAG
jgi:thioredoxin 2